MTDGLTASKAAYKITHVLDLFASHHGAPRFPVDVVALAKDAANQFGWSDPISEVRAEDIKRFEGALIPDTDKRKWMLLYNNTIRSEGRIRFTLAHELGHYLLHRRLQDSFACAESDVINLERNEATIEAQADAFASTLLMPLNDFRTQISGSVDFEGLGACANRYGVSLTAATLRWLRHTESNAVLVVHRDGFMRWAFSSNSAARHGAYFRTRTQTIAVPDDSLAADPAVLHDRIGTERAARTWFPHAPKDMTIREMKITALEYDSIMTLLVMPRGSSVWPLWDDRRS